jgi:hypothetical protein
MPDLSGIITEAFDELQVAAPAGLCDFGVHAATISFKELSCQRYF